MDNARTDSDGIDALLDSMTEALVEIGIDSRILRANKSVERMLGIPVDSLPGKSAVEFAKRFVTTINVDVTMVDALGHSNGVVSGDCSFAHQNGKELYLNWVLSPLEFQGAARGRLLTLMDLTDRHELRLALLHEREDFLAVLNHRLRTPVLATERIIQLFLDGQFGDLSEKQEQLISLLGDNVAEINRLMLMIMDIYRYRSSTKILNLCEVDFGGLVSRLLPKIQTQRLPVDFEISCPNTRLLCDEEQIDCMLTHLVENAVKYARNSVKIRVSEKAGAMLEISVEDDGKGIAEEDIKGLFDRFYLVSASGKYAPVTGAGLCLCSEIAKAHAGKIACKSVLGAGTRFEIHIPIRKDERPLLKQA